MEVNYSVIIVTVINFLILIVTLVVVYKGVIAFKKHINRNKDIDKKLDTILDKLEKDK